MPETLCEAVADWATNQTPDFQARFFPHTQVNAHRVERPQRFQILAGGACASVEWDMAKPPLLVAITAPHTVVCCAPQKPSLPHHLLVLSF